jgi:hypothetical protein
VLNDAVSYCVKRHSEVNKVFSDRQRMTSEEFFSHMYFGFDVQKQLIMFVKLYFPLLSQTHQRGYIAYDKLSALTNKLADDSPPSKEDFGEALAEYSHWLGVMMDEIIANKPILIGSSRLLHKYERASLSKPDWRFPF